MDTMAKLVMRWIMVCCCSFLAALVIIAIDTVCSSENKERINTVNQEIAAFRREIQMLRAEYAKLSEDTGWKSFIRPYHETVLKAQIEFKEFQILKKESELRGLSPEMLTLFKQNCAESLWRYFFRIFLLLTLGPLVVSLIIYYGVARFVEQRIKSIRVSPGNANAPSIVMISAEPSRQVVLSGSEHLYLRGGWYKSRSGVNSCNRFMWRWSAPLITFAADLFELVDFSALPGKEGVLTIVAPVPDLFIAEVQLAESSEIVIRPRHLIGVTDGVKIRTVWNLSLHNLLSGRIRQVILYGKGRILVSGSWGLDTVCSGKNSDFRIESRMLVGYDAGAAYSLTRTETWWHYFRKETELFDVRIQDGVFITQNTAWSWKNPNANIVEKSVQFILNGIGSFFGL